MPESPSNPVDDLYEQVRRVMPAADAPSGMAVPVEVAPGIRVLALRTPTLPPAAHTNAYLVGPERGEQALVDPGSPYGDQQALLDAALEAEREAGRPLGMVLLTHHHGDHIGGAAATAARWGVQIAAHAATARRVADRVAVTRLLEPDETIALGPITITCVFTPGHAEGHLCFEVGTASIAGDMVAGLGTILIDPDEGDMALYMDSLRAMLARPATTLLPAHGPTIVDGAAKLREYLAHRSMREARVVDALTRGTAPLADLVAAVYTDTPRALWALAERSLLAHLRKLAREGRAREVDAGRWSSG